MKSTEYKEIKDIIDKIRIAKGIENIKIWELKVLIAYIEHIRVEEYEHKRKIEEKIEELRSIIVWDW